MKKASAWVYTHAPAGTRWGTKTLALLLSLALCLTLLPTAAFAAENGADITGSGASDDPYLIYTAAGLKAFRDAVNGQNGLTKQPGAHAKLMNDIVLNDGTFDADGNWSESGTPEQWTPIGDFSGNKYSGTFDGGGHTIEGLYINSDQTTTTIGLFGFVENATIENLTVTGYVKGGSTVGSLVGRAWSHSTIRNCVNRSNVTGTNLVGGLVGLAGGSSINIQDCINYGNVKGEQNAGGIMGQCGQGTIANCANLGKVEGTGAYIGGIVGYTVNSTEMTSCYNVGQVEGAKHTGGLVGGSGWWASSGIYTSSLTVNNCYYLDTAAQKALGEALHFTEDTSAWRKTKTEFANGDVLALLQNGDENSPWEKCGYLAAAGMTVPLLDWQTADAHTCTPGAVLGQCGCGRSIADGTAEDPYEIYTADHLKQFRDIVNGQNGQTQNSRAHATLMNDIVLNDGTFDAEGNWSKGGTPEQWTPINNYAGVFNGNGHIVKGVYVTGEQYAGLFGSVQGGTVKDVAVTGYVEGTQFVGGIAGYGNDATISGCTNHATVKATHESNILNAGGIAGLVRQGTITDCTNTGVIITELCKDFCNVGGIVGSTGTTWGTTVTIQACANLGSVSAFLDDDYAAANVGGIVGRAEYRTDITDCFNAGALSVTEENAENTQSRLGGIFGCSLYSKGESPISSVSNCYSVGTLTYTGSGAVDIRGIAGWVSPHYSFNNCYWLEGTAESGIGGSPTSVSSADAKTKAEFANGTVLGLLKGKRDDSPWADECEYVDAAGMTLPILKRQSGSHKHAFEWKHTDTEHWQECVCGATQNRGEHSGGSTCDVCGKVLRSSSTGGSSSRPGYTVTVEKSTNGSVSADRRTASRGTTVTITVTPDKGYTLETITVLDKNGKEVKLTQKNGKYTFTMPSGSVTVTATFMDDNTMLNFFVDVKASGYYYDAVLWAAQNGVTSGTDAVHFSPSLPCTRAQIVTFLWRAAGCPVVNYAMNMTDVPEDAYYAEAVRWALSLGITTGTTATTFSPDETCTRAQAVAFLFRYAAPAAVTLQELVSGFSDAASVPGYALASMNWALAEGIVQGSGTMLMPNDFCTRAQIVTFLYRALEK